MRRLALALALISLALLAWPASALAVDRYVERAANGGDDDSGTNDCTNDQSPCETIQHAADEANSGDVIHIGPGTFDAVFTDARLTFQGAGAAPPGNFNIGEHTRIDADPGDIGIHMADGGGVRDLIVDGADNPNPAFIEVAIQLEGNPSNELSYELSNVTATGGRDTTDPDEDLSFPALRVQGGGAALDVDVSDSAFHAPELGKAVEATGAGSATFTRATLSSGNLVPATSGIAADNGFELRILDLRVGNPPFSLLGDFEYAASALAGSQVTVERSSVVMGPNARGVVRIGPGNEPGGRLEIADSLLAMPDADSGAAVIGETEGTADLEVDIRSSTLFASGTQELGALSLWAPSSGGGDITATARNTVFRATSSGPFADVIVDADPGTSITLDATHSAYTTLFTEDDPTVPPPGTGTNVSGDPLLTADFRPTATSPLVDRGDPALFAASALDLAGNARSLDGNGDCVVVPDIGAFELTGFGAACPAGGGPGVGGSLTDLLGPLFTLRGRTITLNSRGEALIPVTCARTETEPCAGLLTLTARVPANIAQRRRRRARNVRLGSRRFSVQPGRTVRVRIRLSRRNRARLRRARRLRAVAVVRASDRAGNVVTKRATFTLKPRRVRSRRR